MEGEGREAIASPFVEPDLCPTVYRRQKCGPEKWQQEFSFSFPSTAAIEMGWSCKKKTHHVQSKKFHLYHIIKDIKGKTTQIPQY